MQKKTTEHGDKGCLAKQTGTGADPRFFLGGGALVSCSTSTPKNHIVVFFFLQNTSCIRKPQVISGGGGGGVRTPCTLPLDPPLWEMVWKGSFTPNKHKNGSPTIQSTCGHN